MKGRTVIKIIADLVFVGVVFAVSESGLTPLNLAAMSLPAKAGTAIAMTVVLVLFNMHIDRSYTEDGKPRPKA